MIETVLSDKKLSDETVYRDVPLIFTAAQMKNYMPPEYAAMKKLGVARRCAYAPTSEIFYRQGKLMEEFTDDYDYRGDFTRYYPTYADLKSEELRGYFSWRTRLRQGDVKQAPMPFAFLYLYELINLIGVSSPEDGFLKMKGFAQDYGRLDRRILPYTGKWLVDYAVYYQLEPSLLTDLPALKNDAALIVLMDYPNKTPAEITAALEVFSSYKITDSAFYKKQPQAVDDVVSRVFRILAEHYEKKPGGSIFTSLFGRPVQQYYGLFESAVFYQQAPHEDCVYEINRICRFICRNNSWREERFYPVRDKAGRLGALLKDIDCCLRKTYGHRSSLKYIEISALFETAIHQAIAGHAKAKRESERAAVEIDVSKLREIRAAADLTREKLIVEESEEAEPVNPPAFVPAPEPEPAPVSEPVDGCELDVPCRVVLSALLTGGNAENAARECGIMLSLAIDHINDALFDRFGDTVIVFEGDAPEVIADYTDELKGMLQL